MTKDARAQLIRKNVCPECHHESGQVNPFAIQGKPFSFLLPIGCLIDFLSLIRVIPPSSLPYLMDY